MPAGFRVVDLMIEGAAAVEIGAVRQLHPVHDAQLPTYTRLSGLRLRLLSNFHETVLKNGIHRKVL